MQQQTPYTQPLQPLQPYNQQYTQQNRFLKMIPVTNRVEADSTQVDYSGTPTFFYNQTTGEIYKKQFDIQTGLATFQEFKRIEPSELAETKETTYLDMETYKRDYDALYGKIDGLELTIQKLIKSEGKNAK